MIVLDRLTKEYVVGGAASRVLDDVSLTVERGEIAAVVGPSGAGKSTLAKCINLLERPTSGRVLVDGVELSALRGRALRRSRHSIGTIFQGASLLRRRTAADNVALPLDYFGVTSADRRRRVAEVLELVGLSDKAAAYPAQLSGGQQQRVGIARALALRPGILLADEATSGLDPDTTASILGLLRDLRDELDLTVILITHEMDVVRDAADTVWRLESGRVAESGPLTAILADAGSRLRGQLLPHRPAAAGDEGVRTWQLSYGADLVPADWLLRVADEVDARIGLLGATVESVHGRLAGRVTVAFPGDLPEGRIHAALGRVGLSGQPTPVPSAQAELPERASA
jgi:D-methionine transport system ATP-binding protein